MVTSSNFGFLITWVVGPQPEVKSIPNSKSTRFCYYSKSSRSTKANCLPSNLIAVAAATAALCCSTVPPASKTRILLRLAIGHPEALQIQLKNPKFWGGRRVKWIGLVLWFRFNYLRWERNFPVEWPEPSQPGIGHLVKNQHKKGFAFIRFPFE